MKTLSKVKIAHIAKEVDFSGAVSLSSLRRPSMDLTFGFADRGHRVPSNIETRFAMASGSKIFTAAAVGLLMQEGKVELKTPLSECVSSRKLNFSTEVTIGQLLNHTSGVPDYFDEDKHLDFSELWRDRPCYRMTSAIDFLPLFEKKSMVAPPGEGFHYSNSGYVLLGLIIEELAGRNFQEFVAERLFRPCGMNKTGYFALDMLPENTAVGYLSSDNENLRTNIYSLPSIGGPDGGAYTTVRDIRLFWTALLAGKILSQELLNRFLSPSVRVNDEDKTRFYGYGVWLRQADKSWIASVVGNDPGVSMVSRVWLKEGGILTILSNVQDGTRRLSRALEEVIES